ncbi:hypothetical protein WSM22_40410 [Cytophagales bacterium WSM2-2]|nr:hypothetical protein WSM22_40410 [Cytophagales bacterium WSM2-2]
MATATLTIKDETSGGKIINEINISLKQESVSVQEIIEARVEYEVKVYNDKLPEYFQGLVQPTNAEKTLNGYKMRERKKVDPEKQVYIALDAFQKNAYFVLVDDKQVESLEQTIVVKPQTVVSFVKLTPLVGG